MKRMQKGMQTVIRIVTSDGKRLSLAKKRTCWILYKHPESDATIIASEVLGITPGLLFKKPRPGDTDYSILLYDEKYLEKKRKEGLFKKELGNIAVALKISIPSEAVLAV